MFLNFQKREKLQKNNLTAIQSIQTSHQSEHQTINNLKYDTRPQMSINHALDTLYNKVNLLESMLEDKKNVNNTKKEEDTQEQINIFDLQNKIFHLEKQLILVSKSLKNLENMCIDGYSEFVEQENCISQLPNDSQLHEMIQNVIEDSTTKKMNRMILVKCTIYHTMTLLIYHCTIM